MAATASPTRPVRITLQMLHDTFAKFPDEVMPTRENKSFYLAVAVLGLGATSELCRVRRPGMCRSLAIFQDPGSPWASIPDVSLRG